MSKEVKLPELTAEKAYALVLKSLESKNLSHLIKYFSIKIQLSEEHGDWHINIYNVIFEFMDMREEYELSKHHLDSYNDNCWHLFLNFVHQIVKFCDEQGAFIDVE